MNFESLGAFGPLLLDVVKAAIFLIVGWFAAGAISRFVRRRISTSGKVDPTIGNFFASISKWLILIVVLIAVLQIFGFEATSLVAVLGAATLAIGLALQGTLSNVAAGIMLIVFRPYRLGQYVDVGGTAGTVKDLNIFFTELATPDNVQIIVPNGQAWGAVINNYSALPTRRVQIVFGIDYGDDADQAMAIILEVAAAHPMVHADPEPWVRVSNLGVSSVDLTMRVWCDNADFWEVKFALTKQIKEAFDAKGISIPYPHAVYIKKTA